MENLNNNEKRNAINTMIAEADGNITVVNERLFKLGILPKELIVTKDYTVFANNVNEVFGFTNKGIRNYFQSSHPDYDYIKQLGYQDITKNEVIDLISEGALYYDASADGFVKSGRKFSRISETNNNPVYSDAINTLSINNNGTKEMNLTTAIYIAIRYSEKEIAKELAVNIINAASQKVKVEEEKKAIAKEAKATIEASNKIIADVAKQGFLKYTKVKDVEDYVEHQFNFNMLTGNLKYSDEYFANAISIIDAQTKEITNQINSIDDKIRMLSNEDTTEDNEYEIYELKRNIEDLRFSKEKLTKCRNEYADERSQALKDKESQVDTAAYTMTEIVKEYSKLNPSSKFTSAMDVTSYLKSKNILFKNNQWRLNPNNQWGKRSSILGLFPDGNTLVTIHWNNLGKTLIERLLAYEDGFKTLKNGDNAINSITTILTTNSDDELKTILQYDDYKINMNKKYI